MVTLALEVFLVRLLAYTVHALLIYVVLGVAMLGFGAAGSFVAVRQQWLEPARVPRVVALWSAAFVALLVAGYAAFVRLAPVLPVDVGWQTFAIATVLTAPFLASGVVVTIALSTADERLGRVYAVDLIGSAVGCFLPLVLLGPLGADYFLGLLAVVGAIATWLFAARVPGAAAGAKRFAVGSLAVALVALAWAPAVFPLVPDPQGQVSLIESFAREKGFSVAKVFDRWSATGRVEVYEYHGVDGHEGLYPFRFYAQDNTAGAIMASWDGRDVSRSPPGTADPPPVVRMCNDTFFGQAYFEPRQRVLVIGVGGGADVQCALYHRAAEIDAVEINPGAVAAIRGPFDEFLGGIGSDRRVRFHVQDGRSFAHSARGGPGYDLVQLSGVDTKHFLSSGGIALSENHLYTREAFVDYLESLAPGGVLSLIRFGEGEAMRLMHTALAALADLGAERPERHVLAAQNGLAFGILVRREPFPGPVIAAYERQLWFEDRPYAGLDVVFLEPFDYVSHKRPVLIYKPGDARPPMLASFIEHFSRGDTRPFEAVYRYNISPVTDDRPFFFDLTRYDLPMASAAPHVRALKGLLGSVLVLAALFILLPMWRIRAGLRGLARLTVPLYFAGVGLGFLLVEVWLLHRFSMFLGHQSYSLSAVLATLLATTGLGALYGERIVGDPRKRALAGIAATIALLALVALLVPHVLELAWRAPLALRMAIAVAFVGPLGFVMGFPFPAGLSWVGGENRPALPWCVGINFFCVRGGFVDGDPPLAARGLPRRSSHRRGALSRGWRRSPRAAAQVARIVALVA